jgi:hypothetical protein
MEKQSPQVFSLSFSTEKNNIGFSAAVVLFACIIFHRMSNHTKSKKHKEMVAILRAHLEEDEEEMLQVCVFFILYYSL